MSMFKTLKLQLEGVTMQESLVQAPEMVSPDVQRAKKPAPKLSPEQEADRRDEEYYRSIARGM